MYSFTSPGLYQTLGISRKQAKLHTSSSLQQMHFDHPPISTDHDRGTYLLIAQMGLHQDQFCYEARPGYKYIKETLEGLRVGILSGTLSKNRNIYLSQLQQSNLSSKSKNVCRKTLQCISNIIFSSPAFLLFAGLSDASKFNLSCNVPPN